MPHPHHEPQSGDHGTVVPPVPIPNTEVKRCCADDSMAKGYAKVGRCQIKHHPASRKRCGVFCWCAVARQVQSPTQERHACPTCSVLGCDCCRCRASRGGLKHVPSLRKNSSSRIRLQQACAVLPPRRKRELRFSFTLFELRRTSLFSAAQPQSIGP